MTTPVVKRHVGEALCESCAIPGPPPNPRDASEKPELPRALGARDLVLMKMSYARFIVR